MRHKDDRILKNKEKAKNNMKNDHKDEIKGCSNVEQRVQMSIHWIVQYEKFKCPFGFSKVQF